MRVFIQAPSEQESCRGRKRRHLGILVEWRLLYRSRHVAWSTLQHSMDGHTSKDIMKCCGVEIFHKIEVDYRSFPIWHHTSSHPTSACLAGHNLAVSGNRRHFEYSRTSRMGRRAFASLHVHDTTHGHCSPPERHLPVDTLQSTHRLAFLPGRIARIPDQIAPETGGHIRPSGQRTSQL